METTLTYPTPYGEGSVYYSNTRNCWMGDLFLGKNDDGKKIRKTVSGTDPKTVKDKLDKLRIDIENGKISKPSDITAKEIYYDLLDRRLSLNSVKPITIKRSKAETYTLKPLIDMPIQKIDYHMLCAYFEKIRHTYSRSVIRKAYYSFAHIFSDAVELGLITTNPMNAITPPLSAKPKNFIRALTIEEEVRLIEALKDFRSIYIPQMLISLYTGMRCGEINALTLSDINLRYGYINVDKTVTDDGESKNVLSLGAKTPAGNRQIPLNSMVRPIIEEAVRNHNKDIHEYLFSNRSGGLVCAANVNSIFRNMIEKYNVIDPSIEGRVTFHSLRHTYATRCIESGMDLMVLKNLMGHSTIDMTLDVYSDVFDRYEKDNIYKFENHLLSLGIDITSRL